MSRPTPAPLTPDERALADRLARIGPRGEPSPALDARILAAARAAATPRPSPPRRRWPVALGLAASLVLAVGIAWRLRPAEESPAAGLPQSPPVAKQVASAPTTSRPAAAGQDSATPAIPESRPAAPPPVRESARRPPEPAPGAQPLPDRPAVARALPAPPPAPATAPNPPTAALMRSAPAAEVAAPSENATDHDSAASAAAPSHADTGTDEADAAAQAASADEPLDAMPPATADTPAVKEAWLQRIRVLLDSGDIEAGRTSLQAFVQRFPDYPLPPDLRALLR